MGRQPHTSTAAPISNHDPSTAASLGLLLPCLPGESIYVKMVVKKPGLGVEKEMSELDLVCICVGKSDE